MRARRFSSAMKQEIHMTHHSEDHRSQAMNECIDNCTQCHAICLETINYCLGTGGAHPAPEHIALLAPVPGTCAPSADALLRGASAPSVVCSACAEICRQCADACDAMNDPEMTRCAEVCRRCAESCSAMAA